MPATETNNSSSNSNNPTILKDTRVSKGLTLEIVHEATKIPLDALKAIEEGYSSRILSPFYYRGFIKIYAEFLGLNVKEVYRHHGLDQPTKVVVPTNTPVSTPAPARKAAGVPRQPAAPRQPPAPRQPAAPRPAAPMKPAEPNLILEQVQEFGALLLKPKNLQLLGKIFGAFVLFVLLFRMGGCIVSHLHQKPTKKVRVYKVYHEDDTPQKPAPVVVAGPPKSEAEVVAPAVAKAEASSKVELAVRANRSNWIQVKTDGNVVFQMTLNKGAMESWTADKEIELSGRALERLDMEVNGKHIGTLGGGERRIRKVLITKEGLTVKK
jgi:hypothetical protein